MQKAADSIGRQHRAPGFYAQAYRLRAELLQNRLQGQWILGPQASRLLF
jgi:hypothetical protein